MFISSDFKKHLRNEATSDSASLRRTFLERSVQALQRRSGPNQISPDVPVITSFDIIITREKLGTGGFGKVYKGYWRSKVVAVKVLNETVPENVCVPQNFLPLKLSLCLQMMIGEVDVWKRLAHPNILQFYGANPLAGQPFLVSALMANGDAIEYLRKNPNADRTQIVGLDILSKLSV